jgi:hypothetical protein
MSHPVNGHGAVDLGALKAAQAQRAQLEAQRAPLTDQLCTQMGLICPCGTRVRGEAVIYFTVIDTQIPTPQGPQPGLNLVGTTCCSRKCPHAIVIEASAIARRDGLAGRITWLDEKRAARAASVEE